MTIGLHDLLAMLPLLVTAGTVLIALLGIAACRHHLAVALTAAAGYGAALLSLPVSASVAPRRVTALLVMDRYALFYTALILLASLAIALLSHAYLRNKPEQHEEYYVLLLLASLGAEVLVASRHVVSLFLGLELLSVSLYGLIAYLRTERRPMEAGLKYVILSAASSSFLLFGLAIMYFETGGLVFRDLAAALRAEEGVALALLGGLGLLLTGLGFTLAVVPFHMWTPDVYEGAPAPVTAFVATVSKGAVVAFLLRLFVEIDGHALASVWAALSLVAAASMILGNGLALLQENVKRLLAYSSIAHLGYLLVAFLASGPLGVEAVGYYLVAYFVTTLGAFGVVTVLSGSDRDADRLADYEGLFWRRPWLATVFTLMLLSLAGIPLTAGFIGKFYVIAAGVDSRLWALVVLFVLNSVVGLFYYLRVLRTMLAVPDEAAAARPLPWTGGAVLAGLAVLLVWLGIYPDPLIAAIQRAGASLVGAL